MQFKPGTKLSVTNLRRLSRSIPSSYTVVKMGSKYYAECNLADGTDYSGSDATTIIQEVMDSLV